MPPAPPTGSESVNAPGISPEWPNVPDHLLDHFVVTAPMSRLADAIMARYAGLATRVVHYFAGLDWTQDPTALGRWADVARELTTA